MQKGGSALDGVQVGHPILPLNSALPSPHSFTCPPTSTLPIAKFYPIPPSFRPILPRSATVFHPLLPFFLPLVTRFLPFSATLQPHSAATCLHSAAVPPSSAVLLPISTRFSRHSATILPCSTHLRANDHGGAARDGGGGGSRWCGRRTRGRGAGGQVAARGNWGGRTRGDGRGSAAWRWEAGTAQDGLGAGGTSGSTRRCTSAAARRATGPARTSGKGRRNSGAERHERTGKCPGRAEDKACRRSTSTRAAAARAPCALPIPRRLGAN